ncbi:MAG: hypothetical protein ACRCWR_04235, partial [Saezia sp.]
MYDKTKQLSLSSKKSRPKSRLSALSKALLSGLLISSALLGGSAYAQVSGAGGISGERVSTVKMPNAEFVERVVDLRVKVLGGEVKFERTWSDGSWRMNEAWSNLMFYYKDPKPIFTVGKGRSAGSVTAYGSVLLPSGNDYVNKIVNISRAGTMYALSDDNKDKNVDIYVEMGSGNSFIRRTENEWRWYDREGNWISYDKDGRLMAYGDRNGINVSFIRDGSARRMGVKDHYGNTVLSFTYDGGERLKTVTDNQGRQATYHWTGDLLTGVTDVEGHLWSYGYDAKGNLTSRTEPGGATMRLTNHGETAKRKGTHLNSQKNSVYIYPERAGTGYSGVLSSGSSSGKQRGSVLSLKRADEEAQAPTPPRVGTITATNGATTLFNINYNRAAKQFTATQTDELGKITTEVYNDGGRILSRSINGDTVLTRQYTGKHYIQSTDECGLNTSVTYNESGKPTRVTHPNGSVETYTYDNTFNKPLTYVDQLGVKTEWTYDHKGNALTRIDAAGKEEQRFNSWTYDTVGQAVTYSISTQANASDEDKITTRYAYDANGNIKTVTDPMGNT